MAIATPSYMQGIFLERTLRSVFDQNYPKLAYAIHDACSTDETQGVLRQYFPRLASCVSEKDSGQSDAICRAFARVDGEIMGWVNSDDLIVPGALRYVGEYFAAHPSVDVVYGHRILIDQDDLEIGRWVLPPHDNEMLRWVDYVPQETLFWRRKMWDRIGGVDRSFQFALDWDLLLRLQRAGAKILRLPYFLGCFRVHPNQKTSQAINSIGSSEMSRLRLREHGRTVHHAEIARYDRRIRLQAAWASLLLGLGIR
jgi:glycosyltransferase involved in cell wall biosynthesis